MKLCGEYFSVNPDIRYDRSWYRPKCALVLQIEFVHYYKQSECESIAQQTSGLETNLQCSTNLISYLCSRKLIDEINCTLLEQ